METRASPLGTHASVLKTELNKWVTDNSLTIGNTPLVKLNRVTKGCKATVLAKIEGRNPAFSVKCRIGASMIWEAEKSGALRPGMTVVEPTSGNTGIALAFVTAARGYKCLLVMPESMSIERRKVIKVLGAKLKLTDAFQGMRGAIVTAESIVELNPDKYYMPQQFKNPANPLVHELTTGPEIWEATDGKMDVLVCGVGTGGTITGITRYWRQVRQANLFTVAVEPNTSPVLTQTRKGLPVRPGGHKIQGIGAGFVPDTLDLSLVDEIETVTQDEACEMARNLATQEGILCGISCGAAAAVAIRLAKQPRFEGKTIVVVLPDSGERYLSSCLFDTEEFQYLENATAASGIL